MSTNTAILSKVVEQTSHFRALRGSQSPQSILDMSFSTQTIQTSDGSSILSITSFSFDNEVVNSQAYRNALAKAYAAARDESKSTDIGNEQEIKPSDALPDDT